MGSEAMSYRSRVWGYLVLALIVAALLWLARPDILHERIVPVCEVCGHDLSGNVSGVHSECGEAIVSRPRRPTIR